MAGIIQAISKDLLHPRCSYAGYRKDSKNNILKSDCFDYAEEYFIRWIDTCKSLPTVSMKADSGIWKVILNELPLKWIWHCGGEKMLFACGSSVY